MAVKLFQVLTTEQDILFIVVDVLDISSLCALEATCIASRVIFAEYGVWWRVSRRYRDCRYLGQDWSKKLMKLRSDETSAGYKTLMGRIVNIGHQWVSGPVRVSTIRLNKEPVTDVAMDEMGLVVGLRVGEIHLYTRDTFKLIWNISSKQKKLTRLGLNCNFVFSGEACPQQGGSPSVRIWFRETGELAHILSFPGDHSVNWIFPGLDNLVLVSHPSYDIAHPDGRYRMFSGNLSVFSVDLEIPGKHWSRVVDTSSVQFLKYSKDFFLSQNSLSSCKRKFLANDIHKPESLLLIDMKTGSQISEISTTISEHWMNVETLQYGFITSKVVYINYRDRTELNGIIKMKVINIEDSSNKKAISLSLEDTFSLSNLRTNWRMLISSDRQNKRVTISEDGQIEHQIDPGLVEASSCMDTFADAVTLVHYIRRKFPERGYALVVQDYWMNIEISD